MPGFLEEKPGIAWASVAFRYLEQIRQRRLQQQGDLDSKAMESVAATLVWSGALRTGLDVVDRQHQKLLALFNALASAEARGTDTATLQSIFEELKEYTKYHFRAESDLMREWPIDEARRDAHLAAHREFCEFLENSLKTAQSSDTGRATVAAELLGFLAQWLLHHIMSMDVRMARDILQLQAGSPIAQAPQYTTPATEDALIDLLSQVNARLGRRTLDLLNLSNQLKDEVEKRNRMEAVLLRLKDFNNLLAQANQAISLGSSESELLQEICDLASEKANLAVTYVAQPDAGGVFNFLATAGNKAFVEGLVVSNDADEIHGQGAVGNAWRKGQAIFVNSVEQSETQFGPWIAHMRSFGLHSCAALPLFRGGRRWAILAVYLEHENVFDDELKGLLEELARDISRGLDRLDLIARERQSSLVRENLLSNALVGIVMTRGRQIVDANDHFSSLLGYPSKEVMLGQATRILYPDEEAFIRVKALYPVLSATGTAQLTSARFLRKDGRVITCDLSGSMAYAMGSDLVVWTVVDVSMRDQLQAQIEYESLHDPLTGLPNRRALDHDLPMILTRAHRADALVAVGMIDLDDFKPVNDNFGHEAGDDLLRELARRLRAGLRESDLLVRLGGDEFVVVLEGLEDSQVTEQLQRLLSRLHQAVESPFNVGHHARAELGMTMGISFFPKDAQNADALIRQADGAMYQAKQNKHDRSQWWRFFSAGANQPEMEPDTDAFGQAAIELLRKAQSRLYDVGGLFAEAFYANLASESGPEGVLRTLNSNQLTTLIQRQTAHLKFLLAPETTREMIIERAKKIGEIHALVGVTGAWLSKAQSLYRELLSEHLNHLLMPTRERFRTLRIAEVRLQQDIQVELEMESQISGRYLSVLASPLPPRGSLWSDSSADAIAELGRLPGIQAVLLMRLNPDGVLAVEDSAGPLSKRVSSVLQRPGSEAVLDPSSARGQGLTAQAWRSMTIVSSPSYATDERYTHWQAEAEGLGIRSALSLPVINDKGHVVVVISFFGAYPHQFESDIMRHFARGLEHRWEQIWAYSTTPAPVIAQERAKLLRQQLLFGGLRMYMQPILELRSRKFVKVEALARLQMQDGEIIPPADFLPLLGAAELDRLFRLGLDQALGHVKDWEAQGINISISVNLPPSTLLDADCSGFVRQVLDLNP